MSLPNPGMSFTPFDILPASDLNDIVENIEALALGTGLNDGVITTSKLSSGSNFQPVQKERMPYKFRVYRAAAWASSNSYAKVDHDTTDFDTGTNTTGSDRFIAPEAGWYYFNAQAGNTVAGATPIFSALYKNAAQLRIGQGANTAANGSWSNVHGFFLLAQNDFIEHYFIGGGGSVGEVGLNKTFFEGFMLFKT